jgi:Mn2+/Fe2+ NRAMP family transporter
MSEQRLPKPSDVEVTQPSRPKLIEVMGPGLSTGASDDDPSGIAIYSQAGAQFGYAIGWTMLFSYPMMCAIRLIRAEIGRVTGPGIAGNTRGYSPSWLLYLIGADLGAMAAALRLLRPIPAAIAIAFGKPNAPRPSTERLPLPLSWARS